MTAGEEIPPTVLEQIRAHAREVAAKAPKELTPRLRDELARSFIPTYRRIVAEQQSRETA